MIIHIIFLILKIIGFLLLGLLCLIIFLTAFFLISPFVYTARISGSDTVESIKAEAKFHWLLHLLSGGIKYENGTINWNLRIAWKKLSNDEAVSNDTETSLSEKNNKSVLSETKTRQQKENVKLQQKSVQESGGKKIKSLKEDDLSFPKDSGDKNKDNKTLINKPLKKEPQKKIPFYEKIKKFPEKIKYTFRKMCDTIKSLKEKKDTISIFVNDSIHRQAFLHAIKGLKYIFRKWMPDKADFNIEFGFADPAYTGYVLAFISLIWPFMADYTGIRADFEKEVFRGEGFLSGKIRLFYAAAAAANMIFDKNVRTTFRHIRSFKL